jgi:HK97 family phage major capsid protein
MRQLARVIQIDTGDYSMLHSVGGTGYSWVGEKSDRPQTDGPSFIELKPAMGEIYASPAVTQRLLDDNSFDLENWLIDELAEAFGEGEGVAFITGNGVNKPRGILTYDTASTADSVRAESAVQYVASGASGAFAASNPSDKLIKLVHSLKPRYRVNAHWTMNTNTLEQIRTFKTTTGEYLWKQGLEAGKPDTLLGYSVHEDENMPDVAADSLSIAFGDFQRAYTIVDRNTAMLRDPFTAKPHVLFYTTKRVGAGMRDFRAIKLMKFAAS